jgi:hypothetical protein
MRDGRRYAAMPVAIIAAFLAVSVILNILLLAGKRRAPPAGESSKAPLAWNQEALFVFLEEADDNYMLAFTAKNIDLFAKYCTIPCAQEVQNRILYFEERNFGLPNKRKRKWSIVKAEDDSILLKKELIHARDVKTRITTGDDFTEYWKVIYNKKFLVCSIRT